MNEILLGEARSRILQDSTLSEYGKVQALTALQHAVRNQPEETPHIGYGDVIRGAIGAGLGYGVSNLLGKFLSVDDDTLSKMRTIGMGLGTMINTGLIKGAAMNDERNAFRLGFLKAASDLGLFAVDQAETKCAAMVPLMIPLTPDTFLAPARSGFNAMSEAATGTGAGLSAMDAPDETDVDMVRMELERQELERQASKLEAGKRNQALKALLKRRRVA